MDLKGCKELKDWCLHEHLYLLMDLKFLITRFSFNFHVHFVI
jgi:hypothetical protein